MNLLEHDAHGATIRLEQQELLLVMALVQEGRDSFGCETPSGQALDRLLRSANLLVEEARRENLKATMLRHKIGTVVPPEPGHPQDASNG